MSEKYYASLSNSDIKELLKSRKIKCGPVSANTRSIYISKLVRYDRGSVSSFENSKSTPIKNNRSKVLRSSEEERPRIRYSRRGSSDSSPIEIKIRDPSRSRSTPLPAATTRRSFRESSSSSTPTSKSDDNDDPDSINFSPYATSRNVRLSRGSPGHTPYVKSKSNYMRKHPKSRNSGELGNMESNLQPINLSTRFGSIGRATSKPSTTQPVSYMSNHSDQPRIYGGDISQDYYREFNDPNATYNLPRRTDPASSSHADELFNTDSARDSYHSQVIPANPTWFNVKNFATHIIKICGGILLFFGLYSLLSYFVANYNDYFDINSHENEMETCVIKSLYDKNYYQDCNSVNGYYKTMQSGVNALNVNYLYSLCQHLLPPDHRLMEAFMASVKEISHRHHFICYEPAMNIVDCTDNIFYITLIPSFFRRFRCGLLLLVNAENMFTMLVAITVASFCVYIRSRNQIKDSNYCMNIQKSALFMLNRQRDLCLKGYVEKSTLPIALIRDSLIPPQNRRKLRQYWDIVEKNINENRLISCEVCQISGLDTRCWMLLATDAEYGSFDNLSFIPIKRWYPALNDVGNDLRLLSTNQISSVPTCFFKIFNAHVAEQEAIPRWEKSVFNAIIERCNYAGAIIIHLKVDAANIEGVVYGRAVDENSAILAYNTINNMWLDGNQLIFKFLRKDQYFRKFPDARDLYSIVSRDETLPSSFQ